MLHNIVGAGLELYFAINNIYLCFLVVMHDKFGVLALSERWIQRTCKKKNHVEQTAHCQLL